MCECDVARGNILVTKLSWKSCQHARAGGKTRITFQHSHTPYVRTYAQTAVRSYVRLVEYKSYPGEKRQEHGDMSAF